MVLGDSGQSAIYAVDCDMKWPLQYDGGENMSGQHKQNLFHIALC